MNNRLSGAGFVLLASVVTTYGCSSSDEGGYETIETDDNNAASAGSGSGSGGASSGSGSTVSSGTPTSAVSGSAVGNITTGFQPGTSDPVDETCAAADTPTSLQKVVMAFVFDVSASMGSEQEAYFSRALKWDPVVAATKAFFADASSKGMSASLTFFPNAKAPIADGTTFMGTGEECVAADYATPDVPVTALPSTAFATAIDAVTPPDETTWRLGTPTLPAVEGTIQAIQALQAADPNSRYTMVLVTDGMPALCPADFGAADPNRIEAVADAVAAVADTIPTYVIGVDNPVTDGEPEPPDTVTDLNLLAQAGGTDTAFIIDTNDPTATSTQFKTIVDTIRDFSFSCGLAIPEPTNGEEFDKNKVNVKYTSPSLGEVPFTYDPTCPADGNGWYYDNEAAPTTINICANVCEAIRVQQDEGSLSVELGCQTRIK